MDSGTFRTTTWRRMLLETHPNANKFHSKGSSYYKLLGLIFNPSTTTGVLHYFSTQDPPNTDDEDEMDDNLEHGGVHVDVDVDCEILDDSLRPKLVGRLTTYFRKCTTNSQLDCRDKKKSRLSQMGNALKAWVEASKVRTETSRARTKALLATIERYKIGTSSDTTSALEKFTSPDWREIFFNMLDERKRTWLD
ncbi:hypothetical protein AAG906_026189 [Vitis piasezkii]